MGKGKLSRWPDPSFLSAEPDSQLPGRPSFVLAVPRGSGNKLEHQPSPFLSLPFLRWKLQNLHVGGAQSRQCSQKEVDG